MTACDGREEGTVTLLPTWSTNKVLKLFQSIVQQ